MTIAELDTVSPVKPVGTFHYFKPVQDLSWDWESLPSISEKQTFIPSSGYFFANNKIRKKSNWALKAGWKHRTEPRSYKQRVAINRWCYIQICSCSPLSTLWSSGSLYLFLIINLSIIIIISHSLRHLWEKLSNYMKSIRSRRECWHVTKCAVFRVFGLSSNNKIVGEERKVFKNWKKTLKLIYSEVFFVW